MISRNLVQSLESIQKACEESEMLLSSVQHDFLERKNTGSYYTPMDACDFFWNEFFSLKNITSKAAAHRLISQSEFIEPAAGAGIFLFSLLKKLLLTGCDVSSFKELRISCHDINARALTFVKENLFSLESKYKCSLGEWSFHKGDYLKVKNSYASNRNLVFIGNPPFVKNDKSAKWKNSFADFFEKSYSARHKNIDVAFILPLSFTFSRDYVLLRKKVLSDSSSLHIASFDNIPDCLFKSGKPNSPNTNKANSQRCSMVFVSKNKKSEIYATGLIRWSTFDRKKILSNAPTYFNCSEIVSEKQIPRPASANIFDYFVRNGHVYNFSDLLSQNGKKHLHVGSVARNFISFRKDNASSNHQLAFKSEEDLFTGLSLLSSDVFFQYWLSYGDGFHLTKADIYNFPISEELMRWATKHKTKAKKIWLERERYKKTKLNAGIISRSYDFSNLFSWWN